MRDVRRVCKCRKEKQCHSFIVCCVRVRIGDAFHGCELSYSNVMVSMKHISFFMFSILSFTQSEFLISLISVKL